MQLGLNTIKGLGAQGNNKAAVLAALFATKATASVLGTFGFDANGDTTLKSYGLYKVGLQRRSRLLPDADADEDGQLGRTMRWWEAIRPPTTSVSGVILLRQASAHRPPTLRTEPWKPRPSRRACRPRRGCAPWRPSAASPAAGA